MKTYQNNEHVVQRISAAHASFSSNNKNKALFYTDNRNKKTIQCKMLNSKELLEPQSTPSVHLTYNRPSSLVIQRVTVTDHKHLGEDDSSPYTIRFSHIDSNESSEDQKTNDSDDPMELDDQSMLQSSSNHISNEVEDQQEQNSEPIEVGANDEKMQMLSDISSIIHKKLKGAGPHVALSFHAGIVRVALNQGKSGADTSITQKDLEEATQEAMDAYSENDKLKDKRLNKWFQKYYKKGDSIINAIVPDMVSGVSTTHAEQYIAQDVIDTEYENKSTLTDNEYAGEKGIKSIPEGYKKVVRIGGVKKDCAYCHFDHHGNPFKTGTQTASKNKHIYKKNEEAVFEDNENSSDEELSSFNKGIMTKGTHFRAASGVEPAKNFSVDHDLIKKPGFQGTTIPTKELE